MPLRPPALDDRSYDDLVAELLARIPAHTPEWTHPRVGDPGRTLIELFAWLGDTLLYRANLIPERQRLAFLRLLGSPLRSARSARGLVAVQFKDEKTTTVVAVRPLARIEKPLPFEVRDEFTVLPVSGMACYKRAIGPADGIDVALEQDLKSVHAIDPSQPALLYVTTPVFAGGAPLAEGFDLVRESVDRCLWLALLAPKGDNQVATNEAVRKAIARPETGGDRVLNVGFVPALRLASELEGIGPAIRIPHVWEIAAPDVKGQPSYLALDVLRDGTNGLTQRGVVRLVLPRAEAIFAPTNDVRRDTNAGVGDRPPRLDDEKLAARLVGWIRLRPAPTAAAAPDRATRFREALPPESRFSAATAASPPAPADSIEQLRIAWLGINAVEVEQRLTLRNLVAGVSTGATDQEFQLPATSIEPETLALEVEEDGRGFVLWQRVDDLAVIARDSTFAREARVYVLDSEAGTVRFGDGVRGRIPPAESRIRATLLRAGGGAAGNLPAGTLKEISATPLEGAARPELEVRQPLPLDGGADSESLLEAERRIPALFRHRERAVTTEDYRQLALETPGIAVGRVELLPRFKPQQRLFGVAGVVTVLALPGRAPGAPPNPRADRPFLEALHAWLDGRRPLGTELYVCGCEYRPLGVSTAVSIRDGFERDTTLQAVRDALRRFLWPLAPGGFDGRGWPLGRAISNRELEVEISRVPGVDEVQGVNLFQRAGDDWALVGNPADPHEHDLPLQAWELPELLGVLVVAEADEAPGDLRALPNPFAPANGVAVPVVPKLC